MSVIDFERFKQGFRGGAARPGPDVLPEPVFSVFSLEAGPSLMLSRDLFDLVVIKLAFPENPADSFALAEALVKAAYGEGAVLPPKPV